MFEAVLQASAKRTLRRPTETSAGTLVNLFPADTVLHVCMAMDTRIPVYKADGTLYSRVTEQGLARLQALGLVARVVRHRKGHINRAILFRRSGEGRAAELKDYLGTRYSFREHLENGYLCWKLRRLGRGDELRPIFLAVVAECMAKA